MFHPVDHPLERGWVGRIDGERVVHLAAQTLQSLYTGGGLAREHAEYPLSGACLLAPVLHPPSVRVFESETSFAFANPAAIVGPDAEVLASERRLEVYPRLAAIVGAEGAIAGTTLFLEWRRSGVPPPKDRDFALGLGPVVVTADELPPELVVAVRVGGEERLRAQVHDFDWAAARSFAEDGSSLRPGDLLASPAAGAVRGIGPGDVVEVEADPIGVLRQTAQ
jgi:hypothetical protein